MNQDTEARVRLAGECRRLEGQRERLAALCRDIIEYAWCDFTGPAREALRRSNPEHFVVWAEKELAEITGGPA